MRTRPTLTLADMKEETGISITAIQKLLAQLISKNYVERGEYVILIVIISVYITGESGDTQSRRPHRYQGETGFNRVTRSLLIRQHIGHACRVIAPRRHPDSRHPQLQRHTCIL